MENNSSFKFKIIDFIPYVKGDKRMCRIITYCYYGFNVNFYVTEDIANKIKLKAKDTNFDLTNYVYVFYDNDKQKFAYVINSKKL